MFKYIYYSVNVEIFNILLPIHLLIIHLFVDIILALDWVWNDCMVCTDVRIFWMEVTEINTDQLKQKEETYDKEVGGFWNEKEKKTTQTSFFNFIFLGESIS